MTTSAPNARIASRSSPKLSSRRAIQRGTSAPHISEKRISCEKFVIGMMPGTIGTSTPSLRASSTKRKYASALKKYCVIAEFAPAFTLRAKFSRSAFGERDCGWYSGYPATSIRNQSPCSARMKLTSSDA